MLCNEKYESSKSPVKVIEWEEIICGVGMCVVPKFEKCLGEKEKTSVMPHLHNGGFDY